MAEKGLLDKLREDYLQTKPEAAAAVADFCSFAADWLATRAPTGIGYTIDGLVLRLANGDSFVLVRAPGSDAVGGAVSVTGMDKINAKAGIPVSPDFPITGRQ